MTTDQPDLITTTEALSILGLVSAASISHWVREGRIVPAMKLPGATGAYLFDRATVLAIAAERNAEGGAA